MIRTLFKYAISISNNVCSVALYNIIAETQETGFGDKERESLNLKTSKTLSLLITSYSFAFEFIWCFLLFRRRCPSYSAVFLLLCICARNRCSK